MGKTLGYGEITVANMTEPFTVMLTNEAQQFATDSNRKVTSAQSYYTDIIVIRGSQERTDYTIGNITSGSGITVSKSSKRVTFSVSAGTTIGADTGVIEIPITLDGQTVKKQFSWSCGKQGPQGVKGQDGTSVKITSKSVTYQTSTSGTTAPTGTWLTTVPTVNNGQYLWTKTTVQYSDGNKTEAYSVSYKGTNGTNGTSVTVSKTEVTYQVSTSGTTAPTGAWSTTMPTCDQGQYLWTKTYVKYSDGKETTSYSVSYKGVDGEKFSWNLIQNGKGNEKRGFFKNFSSVNITEGYGEITLTSKHNYIGIGLSGFVLTPRQYEVGEKITWSYDIMYTKWDFPTGSNRQELWMGQRYTNAASGETATGQWVGVTAHDLPVVGQNGCELNKWFHVEVTKTIPAQASSNVGYQGIINFYNSTDISATVTLRMKNVKLEYGDTATPWSPAQSDLEGRGVSQTVQYYLATSQASGVTSSTSGWSTDITTQKLTADKKYLWNCYQTKYSDGTSEPISTPKVIGVYGDKGQNAKNLSITPSSQYFKSTDGGKTFAPNAITIKPTIQGEISFGKWQYSIDGGVSFTDVMSEQKGLTISNNVLTVSKDSSLYSDAVTMITFRAVADDSSFYDTCSIAKIYDVSDIGDGRNLLWNSNFAKTDETINTSTYTTWGLILRGSTYTATIDTSVKHNNFNTLKVIGTKAGDSGGQDLIYRIKGLNLDEVKFTETDVKYTLSFYAKASIACNFSARYAYDSYAKDTNVALSTDWKRYEIQMHPTTTSYQTSLIFKMDAASTVWFSEFKLEKGSSATGYSTAPEDVQVAILSTKSEISDVSLKVDNNKQAIEQRVEKTTYQQDLKLVKGDISKANEGLNKWRYEIYPKSLFTDKPEDQRKISLDVFARNKNIIPTQSILLDDTKLGYFNYNDNYIGYAVTFVKMSEATKLETTFVHDDAGSFYLNGKLICTNGTNNFYSSATPDTVSCTLVKGWNCLEVVINEGAGSEGFKFGTVLSQLSTCQLMNCYYAMVTGRESQITNTLVQNTIDIEGVSTKVGKVTSIIGENGENFTDFKNDYSDFKQTMNGFKTTVGQTYVTKDDFNGLEIGGRNLLLYSQTVRAHNDYYNVGWLTDEVETFNGCPVWSVKNQWGKLGWSFKSHVIDRGLVKVGDTLTYSLYAKTNNASGKRIACSYRFKGNAQGYWFNDSAFNVDTSWARYSVTFTVTKDMLATDTYMNEIGFGETASMSGDDKVYYACPKLERGTKATDYTPAPEDNEINGQNLVSNLPSNWEQGGINGGQAVGSTYASIKSSTAYRIRIKDIFSVSGNITVSAGGTTTNSSKETLSFYGTLYDAKKGLLRETGWKSFPSTINCGDAKYMSIILRWGDGTKTQIAPSDISQICLKIERGTSATPFTLAPEDVNGKIVNVETIANQTAKKFEWIVKGGDKSSSMVLTDDFLNIVANKINLKGKVTFESLSSDAKNEIGKVAQSKVDGLEIGGRNLLVQKNITQGYLSTDGKGSFIGSGGGDQTSDWIDVSGNKYITITLYEDFTNTNNSGRYCEYDADKNCINTVVYNPRQKSSIIIELKSNTKYIRVTAIECKTRRYKIEAGNKATDWTPAPEDYLPQADLVSNWTTNTTWIDGGKIYTGSITADKIAANSITADKIATDAIKSRNYISSGGTQGSFLNLSDGSFQSPNLSWDSNGNLIAKNANLSGEITATNGSIAGWTIISNKMYTTGSGKYTGIGKYGSAYAFWAGATSNDNGNSAVFKVGHTGKLTATDADITGTITATNGKIGRYDITSTYLMTNSGSNASGIGGNQAFWAGAEDSNSAPFRVGYDGVLWAENAAIRGSIETGNLGDEGDTVSIINGHIGIQGTSNNVEIYSTGFKFGIDGDYYLMSVSEGVKCYRNLYATDFVADGWLYCSEVHSSGAVVIGADSESFYWAHGYQIARGTSWGGVCVGDDSQQLRLYGSSIWASHSISTSDENLKENFTTLDQYENFYMNLNPIGFNYIGDYDGKKTHFGFGAHKTEDVLESEGYDADKFAVVTHRPLVQEDIEKRFGKDVEVDIETEYGVSYTEFIALNTHMIQKTRRELTKVKQEKADLEVRLQAIEAKLGL